MPANNPQAYNQDPRYANADLTGYISDTLQGKYLNNNPYLQDVVDTARRDVTRGFDQQKAQIARQAAGPGRLGSSAHLANLDFANAAFGRGLSDAIGGIRASDYEAERGRQNEMAGLSQGRDQSIWGDLTSRYGIQEQSRAQQAAASASAASARYAADQRAKEAQNQFLLGMAGLGENARQFDAGMPLQWGSLASDLLGTLGGQDLQSMGLTGDLLGMQMGNQLGAAQLSGGLDQGFLDQQLGALGQIPGLANADIPGLQVGSGYLADIFGSEAGLAAARANAGAARYGANLSDQLARDQLQFGSVMNQFGAGDPYGAFTDYLSTIGGLGGLAGGTTTVEGLAPGQVVPQGQGSFMGALQGGLGGAASGLGLAMQGGWSPFGGGGGGGLGQTWDPSSLLGMVGGG